MNIEACCHERRTIGSELYRRCHLNVRLISIPALHARVVTWPPPLIWYLREFVRAEWIKKFLFAKTAPLVTPSHFRGFPEPTGKTCQHALFCMMACPVPGAIEVVHAGDGWMPRIHKGHCIRCGLCVEACPNGVLKSGRILQTMEREGTSLLFLIPHRHRPGTVAPVAGTAVPPARSTRGSTHRWVQAGIPRTIN